MAMDKYVKVVNSTAFVDHAQLKRMGADEVTAVLGHANAEASRVVVVDSLRGFFSLKNLEETMLEAGTHLRDLLANRGVELAEDDLLVLQRAFALRERLMGAAEAASVRDYQCQAVPEGWVLEDAIVINRSSVYRKGDSNYTIGVKTLNRIWEHVAPIWASENEGSYTRGNLVSVTASGYNNRSVRLNRDGDVEIGCQTVKRFELEQVAQHLGWEFPVVTD